MLRKKIAVLLLSAVMAMTMLSGCGNNAAKEDKKAATEDQNKDDASEAKEEEADEAEKAPVEDGEYWVDFNTDSGMFHENPDFDGGKATLIVEDGKMTVHITLNSKNIVQLFSGTAKDAQKDGADLIDPSGTETIEYTDGSEPKEVYTFDVPVKKLDEEFDLALIGTKDKWYDHKVSVSNPVAK